MEIFEVLIHSKQSTIGYLALKDRSIDYLHIIIPTKP